MAAGFRELRTLLEARRIEDADEHRRLNDQVGDLKVDLEGVKSSQRFHRSIGAAAVTILSSSICGIALIIFR